MSEHCAIGPIPDYKKMPYGVCLDCWYEKWQRPRATLLDGRPNMVCKKCGKRLPKYGKVIPQFKHNAFMREYIASGKRAEDTAFFETIPAVDDNSDV